MEITSRIENGVTVLSPTGRIDQAHADAFSAAVEPHLADCKAGGTPIVLDFAGVDYISSVGLRALMVASRRAASQQGCIVIAALSPLVREVFEISRFNLVLKAHDTVEAAVQAVRSGT
jgi:anti-anti-sigma factor